MGAEIIAEKFALIKTRGSNGVSFTHIADDTLLGQRVVVKVSDKLGSLGLDYLKTINLAQEANIPGILMPFEGGILEEESGYYLAFPELGEPSLANYLRMGAPLTCREIVEIGEQILAVLQGLHEAGFLHLFVNTRNVFYRPRQGITLKDPAFRQDYFHFLLELVTAPDFYYFSPEVMDGVLPGAEADLYALGRLISRLLEEAVDTEGCDEEALAQRLAERCCSAAGGGEGLSAAGLHLEILAAKETLGVSDETPGVYVERKVAETEHDNRPAPVSLCSFSHPGWKNMIARHALMPLVFLVTLVLIVSIALICYFACVEDRYPVLGRSGGSAAGEAKIAAAFADRNRSGEEMTASGSEGAGDVLEASKSGDTGVEDENVVIGEDTQLPEPETSTSKQDGPMQVNTDNPAVDPSPASPVASFSVSPAEGQSPLQVYLDATSSYDPDGYIVSYAWSCGGSGEGLYRVFESNVIPTTISITLTVTDDGGHTASATKYVTLY